MPVTAGPVGTRGDTAWLPRHGPIEVGPFLLPAHLVRVAVFRLARQSIGGKDVNLPVIERNTASDGLRRCRRGYRSPVRRAAYNTVW